jgi:hypothetical protein
MEAKDQYNRLQVYRRTQPIWQNNCSPKNSIVRALLLCFLLNEKQALGEWEKWEAAPAVSEGSFTFQINNDGSYTENVDVTSTIMNRQGIENFGVFAATYNHGSQKIEILEAKTINGETRIHVDPKVIEDKPIASNLSYIVLLPRRQIRVQLTPFENAGYQVA